MASEIQWNWITGKSGYALLRSSSGTIYNRVADAFEAYNVANYFLYQLSGREQSSGGCYTADFPATVTIPGFYNVEAKDQVAGSGLQSDLAIATGGLWWNGSAVIPAVDLRSGQVSVSGVFAQSGLATAVQVSGIATGSAFVSGVFVQSGIATSVQVSGLMQASGVLTANASGVLTASGFATAVQVSGLATLASLSGFLPVQLPRGVAFNNFPFPLYMSGTMQGLSGGAASISGQISRDGGSFGLLQSGTYSEMGFGWYSLLYLTSGDLNGNSVALRFNLSGADVRDITIVTQKPG